MTELIEVIRTSRKVGSGQSEEDIVHEHMQFFTPDGRLLTEACTFDGVCDYTKDGDPVALIE